MLTVVTPGHCVVVSDQLDLWTLALARRERERTSGDQTLDTGLGLSHRWQPLTHNVRQHGEKYILLFNTTIKQMTNHCQSLTTDCSMHHHDVSAITSPCPPPGPGTAAGCGQEEW